MTRLSLALAATLTATTLQAQDQFWKDVSNIGGPAMWTAGLGSSFIQDGSLALNHAARTGEGLLLAGGLTEGLKLLTRERRPDSGEHDSFPSMHASLSFEIAAAQSYFHPSQSIFWYGAAALVGYSRIKIHRHHWLDVLAGAALGYACGQFFASNHSGVVRGALFEDRARPEITLVSVRF
ncbi:MAG TPA: phosphatase PAP2 family protein [Fimbriimonas sp.]|nr:phosphatase PAP2 family protein [Fimbriimonas sp.]